MVACRARALPAPVCTVPRDRPLPGGDPQPLHHPPLAVGARRVGVGRRPRSLRPVLRAGRDALGRSGGLGLHAQRAQRRGDDGVPLRGLPARGARLRPAPGGQCLAVPSPRPGRRGPAGRSGRLSRRAYPFHARLPGHARWRGTPGPHPAPDRGRLPRGDGGGRLRGGAVLHPDADRARGGARPRGRGTCHADGVRVLAPGSRGHGAPDLGGHRGHARPGDRERDRHRRRLAAHRLCVGSPRRCPALPRRRHRRPRVLLLEPARQLRVGPRVRAPDSAWSRSTRPPSNDAPSPSAPWLGGVARDNAVP